MLHQWLTPARLILRNLLLLLTAGFFLIPAAWAELEAPDRPPPSLPDQAAYRLGVGDQIEVLVWKEPELSRTMQIRQDGRISLPLVGEVQATGKAPQELAGLLEEQYRQYLAEPAVSVILSQSNRHYYVIGQVSRPGEFPLDTHLTVLQALARSGGFLEWAKTSEIKVLRRERGAEKILSFDYDAVVKGDDLSQHLLIAPGDTIIVP